MWAYALVVILSTGDEAPRVYYKHLDQCRWQARELTRAYNNFVPAKSAVCHPHVAGPDDVLIDLTQNKTKQELEALLNK